MITYKIYGHPSRLEMVKNLQQALNVPNKDIYLDDRKERGYCIYTAKKAWLAPLEEGETHRLAIPEDMEICNNFKPIVERMVAAHPKDIIALFPFDYNHIVPKEFWEGITPYIETAVFTCCGTIMPIEYIQPCFDWIYKTYHDKIADDTGIQKWAESHGVRCITTIPSTVQHLGDISLVTPNAPKRISKYYRKDMDPRINWDSAEVATKRMQPDLNTFFYRDKNGKYHVRPEVLDDKDWGVSSSGARIQE